MNTIPALNLGAASNSLHFNILDAVKAAIVKYSIQGGRFEVYVEGFIEAFEKEDKVYQKYDRKYLSSLMSESNNLRIQIFRFLRDEAKYLEKTGSAAVKAAASLVLGAIDLYGGADIPALKVDELTGVLTNLGEDLKAKYQEQMAVLGEHSEQLLDDLVAANNRYKQQLFSRTEADSQYGKEAMAKARAESDKRYRILISEFNNAAEYNLIPELEDFMKYMIELVNRYRIQLGQGSAGSTSSGTGGSEEDGVKIKNATFEFANGNVTKLRVEVGAPLVAQENTFGYIWKPEVPEFMPNRNIVFKEIPITSAEAIATFHFADHREEEIRQIVGTILHGPANTTGYYWEPTVPSTMPAEDTSYYELPLENNGGNNGSGSGENTGTGGGDNTGSGGDNTGGGSGENTGSSNKFTVTYKYPETGEVITTQEYEVGEKIVPPTPPTGYVWGYYPDNMPDRNVFVDALPDVIDF